MEPHVFVVMPFGLKEAQAAIPAGNGAEAQAAITISFDEVYELLIAPALTKAGCIPFRADQEPGAGDIRTDMYFELVTADVILADISILNANVFYELGVRHGVAPRGVLMIHGGWSKRPFDVAPDRTTSDYNGKLFVIKKEERDEAWQQRLDAEGEKLAKALRAALDVDDQKIGSPVYKELVGLKPADWSDIKTATAKYFGEVFADWKDRVELAELNGRAGDILTLAGDAPTRFHRGKLLWQAAAALFNIERFNAAKSVLEELLALEPKNPKAQPQLGLVLSRLGMINEAKVHMQGVANEYAGDPEAQGILGRVYKDLWRLEWKDLESLAERQMQAVASSNFLVSAIQSYDQAARKHFDYYTGINVVTFVKLLEHLKSATGEEPADPAIADCDNLAEVVRFSAQNTLSLKKLDTLDGVWAAATLGELDIVMDKTEKAEKARQLYRNAANAPSTKYFHISSMLDQLCLFEKLGFRPQAVADIKKALEQRQKVVGKKFELRFKRVVIASGHMIDSPDRATERFPPSKEAAVRECIAKQLETWAVGAGDLAICGGARGADILFAELCAERGAEVWLYLALSEGDFLDASVRLPNSDWEDRYFKLRDRGVKVEVQGDRLKAPPKGTSVFARNNLWMINTARVEANDPKNLYALLVWDEKPTGDGPGGTSDFAARVRKLGGRLGPIINPTRL
ncbi:MAG: tetratricopeptide repeat-containing protein [Pyrinomonadaceae bacterium]